MALWWDRIKATFAASGVPADDRTKVALAAAGVAVDADVEGDVHFDGEDAEKEQLRAEVARLKAAEFSRQAEALADGLIAAKKALPAEKPALVAAFAQAAQDDAANPAVVTFAEGKTGSRVEALKAVYEARPAHQLTEEMLKTGEGAALFNKGETDKGGKPMTAERKRELMGMSSLGKACLKEK